MKNGVSIGSFRTLWLWHNTNNSTAVRFLWQIIPMPNINWWKSIQSITAKPVHSCSENSSRIVEWRNLFTFVGWTGLMVRRVGRKSIPKKWSMEYQLHAAPPRWLSLTPLSAFNKRKRRRAPAAKQNMWQIVSPPSPPQKQQSISWLLQIKTSE